MWVIQPKYCVDLNVLPEHMNRSNTLSNLDSTLKTHSK